VIDTTSVPYVAVEIWNALLADLQVVYVFIPMILLMELPLLVLVITGIFHWRWRYDRRGPLTIQPSVSCIITCYAEGDAIKKTIATLCEQTYRGHIEVIAVVDGAVQNQATYQAALQSQRDYQSLPNRTVVVLPKWQRGGRVSTLNAGLAYARGEIVINADGDTSFDNDMVCEVVKEFEDPNVPAAGGSLRVRNVLDSWITRMQAIEYMISMQGSKTGLAEWNLINNVSGAFGAFRRDFLRQIGGWDTHTAEDLDLTVRIKQYMRRFPGLRIPFAAQAIGHTDVPVTLAQLFNQRLRWDGDLVFLYLRKHRYALSPKLLGAKNYLFTIVYGVLQNVLLPVIILIFNLWLIMTYPLEFVAGLLLVQYLYYLLQAGLILALFIAVVSERKRADARALLWIVLYPLYTLMMRLFTVFAILNETLRRGHEESGMAPWWVMKRGHRF
jgi:cellulose synthase/poly-beta-1,6-N-acetylglucosamine synthase-like glycosyltransferase